jgi:hypothetical protein
MQIPEIILDLLSPSFIEIEYFTKFEFGLNKYKNSVKNMELKEFPQPIHLECFVHCNYETCGVGESHVNGRYSKKE